ncbi:MAG: sulfotransferase [Paracoccaceae bacterium]|nr:MAG: sulfotransferase [Paracoccaceae bacterium]
MGGEPTILLGVGATKAGTTWLWDHLAAHPDCHARAIKELHYFDTLENNTFGRQIKLQEARAEKLAASGRGDAALQAQRRADVAEWIAVLRRRVEDIPAYLAYLFGGARAGRRLVMDVTPAYASLPEQRLRQMAGMAADVRVLYLMRDPVSRFWSHVRMIAERMTKVAAEVPDAARALLDAILDGRPSAAVDRGDYAGALARLDAAVAPGRFLAMFQEDLMTAPGYARLCTFLGIRQGNPDFGRRVFASAPVEMTDAQRARLRALLAPQYAAVARRHTLPAAWRQNMDEVSG